MLLRSKQVGRPSKGITLKIRVTQAQIHDTHTTKFIEGQTNEM